jgi:DNA repair protein RecO (recombination protein O)
MAIIKTEGIVLRSQNYLESSKIVTIYGKESGKISLLAKGARRPKSQFGGGVDLLQHVALVYYHKDTRSLQTLSQVDILCHYKTLYRDLKRLSIALAAAEFVDRMEFKESTNPGLFAALLSAIEAIEKAHIPELILYQFLWRWLESAGFKPRLRRCQSCGSIPDRDATVCFQIAAGRYTCANCRDAAAESLVISSNVIRLVLHMRDNPAAALCQLRVREQTLMTLRQATWDFLHYHAEGIEHIKSLNFLGKIKSIELEGVR